MTADTRLIEIIVHAIATTEIDFGISWGHRTPEEQQEVFDKGWSKCDGYNILSKHNYLPSRAVDFYAYVNGKLSYEKLYMEQIYNTIQEAADYLGYEITWGGHWKNFVDLPHIQLR